MGDYYAGPNHVLPTSGTARFFSPLSVESFTKTSSFIYYTQSALSAAAPDITAIAKAETASETIQVAKTFLNINQALFLKHNIIIP